MYEFSDFLKKRESKKGLLVCYGAGALGRLSIEAFKEKNISVDYITDSDPRKLNASFENINTLEKEKIKKLDKNTHFFVTAPFPEGIITTISEMGFKNIYSSIELFEQSNFEEICKKLFNQKDFKGNKHILKVRRNVDFYNETCKKHIFKNNNLLRINTLDVQITEKCSLKCKDCSNLMQYYQKPQDSQIEILFKSIDRFIASIDTLEEFRVLGGDPFMNKEMHKVIRKLTTYDKVKKIAVYTNARIVPKGENLECLKHEKVLVDITNYGEVSKAHDKVVETLTQAKVAFSTNRCVTWQDCGRILPYRGKNEGELETQFMNCCNRDLISLLHGKLYRCPFSANGANLKAIPLNSADEVNLIDDNISISQLREQIKELYLDKKFLTACNFCNGRDFTSINIDSAIQAKEPLKFTVNSN